jgi:hypothetical protein
MDILICVNEQEQQQLIDSLTVLNSEKGLFKRLKSNRAQALNSVKQILKVEKFAENDAEISRYLNMALKGKNIWTDLTSLSSYLDGRGYYELQRSYVEGNLQSLSEKLTPFSLSIGRLLDALKDMDILICVNEQEQQQLIDSLTVLNSEKGLLQKIEPCINALNSVKQILKVEKFAENDAGAIPLYLTRALKGKNIWTDLTSLSNYLLIDGFTKIQKLFTDGKFTELSDNLSKMKDSLTEFEEILTFDKNKMDLSTLEKEIFRQCSVNFLETHNWSEALEQEIFHHWIEYIEGKNPQLKTMPFETYQQNSIRIKELFLQFRNLTVLQIISKIESDITRPMKTRRSRKNYLSYEASLWHKIADDLSKKRKQVPVRKLIEKYQNIPFKLAPCWLASPEAVASIFPLKKNVFDIIIFDEASQLAVERSLPVLYRGGNIVILGDEKQLRPFDLFRMKDTDNEETYEEYFDDSMLSESLLVLAKRIYGYRYLNWHYRSKYQELIDFSNHSFYEGNLNIVPNILRKHTNPPIRWISCADGKWVDRKNIPEALLVVQEIKNILLQGKRLNNKKSSLGVITFNDSQRTAVLDEIENARNIDAEFDELFSDAENLEMNSLDDIPFVKNIENVQGDERDIIIFSIGYAKDANGKLRTMFGSLSQEGGENRLNVAITRAREEIVIICSFDPSELKIESSRNEGPKRLREYLEYAKAISKNGKDTNENDYLDKSLQGSEQREKPVDISENWVFNENGIRQFSPGYTIEEIVREKLKLLGYEVDTKIGNSHYKLDLAVVNPDDPKRYLLGIECDSDSFYAANSVKERDVIRPKFLESRGWIIERTWSKNWWNDPQKELLRLDNKIKELRKANYSIRS